MTRIAHVGAFKRMSHADKGRWMMALLWIVQHGGRLPHGKVVHEPINLKYGRDFLAESEQYDIVVLHDIFDGGGAPGSSRAMLKELFSGRTPSDAALVDTSPLGTDRETHYALWRDRLAHSGAKHVFIFETSPNCVNGWHLGDLPGYTVKHRDHDFTAYEAVAG